jgi:predicted RNase H-like nuclease
VTPINDDAKSTKDDDAKKVDNSIKVPDESKVGKRLSDLTTRRVIILVLAMMFSVPFFSLTTYIEEHKSYKFGL